jgi:hypothetical protein
VESKQCRVKIKGEGLGGSMHRESLQGGGASHNLSTSGCLLCEFLSKRFRNNSYQPASLLEESLDTEKLLCRAPT